VFNFYEHFCILNAQAVFAQLFTLFNFSEQRVLLNKAPCGPGSSRVFAMLPAPGKAISTAVKI
jgi:hypothetical protein